MRREHRIALFARRFQSLANRTEFLRPDPGERIETTLRERRAIPLSRLDQMQVIGSGELDRLCGAAVRRLRSSAKGQVALLDVLGHMDPDRICGVYFALPESTRKRLHSDGAWDYHVRRVEEGMPAAIADINEIAQESEGFAKRRAELVAEMTASDQAAWERFEREMLRDSAWPTEHRGREGRTRASPTRSGAHLGRGPRACAAGVRRVRDPRERAERLRVLLFVMSHKDSGPDHPIDVSHEDWDLMESASVQDHALAAACYEIEAAQDGPAERRAERLRVLLNLGLGHPYLAPGELLGELCKGDHNLLDELTEDDRQLANACLEIERQLRDTAYANAAVLVDLVAAGEGPLEERVKQLPWDRYLDAVQAVVRLGWVNR